MPHPDWIGNLRCTRCKIQPAVPGRFMCAACRSECRLDVPRHAEAHPAFDATYGPYCPLCGRYEGSIAAEAGCDACVSTLARMTSMARIIQPDRPTAPNRLARLATSLLVILQPYTRFM